MLNIIVVDRKTLKKEEGPHASQETGATKKKMQMQEKPSPSRSAASQTPAVKKEAMEQWSSLPALRAQEDSNKFFVFFSFFENQRR